MSNNGPNHQVQKPMNQPKPTTQVPQNKPMNVPMRKSETK
jgi:hypothetical protein